MIHLASPYSLDEIDRTFPVRVRRFVPETDIQIVGPWWSKRGLNPPSGALLPATGVIVEYEGVPAACAFLYEDKAGKVAMIEWECTNPEMGSIRTIKSLHVLFDFYEKYAQEQGIVFILSWTAEERGDGRILRSRKWVNLPGPRHELMCFVEPTLSCPQPSR